MDIRLSPDLEEDLCDKLRLLTTCDDGLGRLKSPMDMRLVTIRPILRKRPIPPIFSPSNESSLMYESREALFIIFAVVFNARLGASGDNVATISAGKSCPIK